MVKIMKYSKFSSLQILLSLFLTKFYINHLIIAPFFYELYSKTAIIILSIIYLVQPFELIFINKLFNKEYKPFKTNNILLFFYNVIFSTLILLSLVYLLDLYIYNVSNIYLIILGLLIPLLFINKYSNINIFRLTPLFSIFIFIMMIFLFFSLKDFSIYTIYPNTKINNLPLLIILTLNIILPYVLFPSLKELSSNNFKLSNTIILSIIFSIFNILITIRDGLSLGILINSKVFPFYESLRFSSITAFSLPIDILYIIFIIFYSFYVLSILNNNLYISLNINNSLIKNILTIIPFIFLIILINNISLFNIIKYDLLAISTFSLIYILISNIISYSRRSK